MSKHFSETFIWMKTHFWKWWKWMKMATVYQKVHFGVLSLDDGSITHVLKAQMRVVSDFLSSLPTLPCLWLNFAKFLSKNVELVYCSPTHIK